MTAPERFWGMLGAPGETVLIVISLDIAICVVTHSKSEVTSHTTMSPTSKLLVIERILPEGNEYNTVRILDMHMLVLTSEGKERTEKEYRQLFESNGYSVNQLIRLPSFDYVFESVIK